MMYADKSDKSIPRKKKTTIVEETIEQMIARDGYISPKNLVDEAHNPKHRLHKFFEWDDAVAGEKYRISQATQMILSTKFVCMLVEKQHESEVKDAIEKATSTHHVRKYLPDFSNEGTFNERHTVLSDAETRKAIIDKKVGVLRSWCASVIDISELNDMRLAIEEMVA